MVSAFATRPCSVPSTLHIGPPCRFSHRLPNRQYIVLSHNLCIILWEWKKNICGEGLDKQCECAQNHLIYILAKFCIEKLYSTNQATTFFKGNLESLSSFLFVPRPKLYSILLWPLPCNCFIAHVDNWRKSLGTSNCSLSAKLVNISEMNDSCWLVSILLNWLESIDITYLSRWAWLGSRGFHGHMSLWIGKPLYRDTITLMKRSKVENMMARSSV